MVECREDSAAGGGKEQNSLPCPRIRPAYVVLDDGSTLNRCLGRILFCSAWWPCWLRSTSDNDIFPAPPSVTVVDSARHGSIGTIEIELAVVAGVQCSYAINIWAAACNIPNGR